MAVMMRTRPTKVRRPMLKYYKKIRFFVYFTVQSELNIYHHYMHGKQDGLITDNLQPLAIMGLCYIYIMNRIYNR